MDAETFANDAAALRSAPAETPSPAASSDVSEKVRDALIEALPNLAEAELVDLLEFVYTQHSGSNFNADNTSKAHATAVFVESRPFAISKRGVASLCKLARYSLEKSEGKPKENNAEHQLWLLMSGALNTAAAIADFDGDAAGMFNAAVNDGVVRGKYVARHFATVAMRDFVEKTAAQPSVDPTRAPYQKKYLTQENLPTAMIYATVIAVVLGWALQQYLLPA